MKNKNPYLTEHYKKYNRPTLEEELRMLKIGYDKKMDEWSMVMINQKKRYVQDLKLKIDVITDILNG